MPKIKSVIVSTDRRSTFGQTTGNAAHPNMITDYGLKYRAEPTYDF